MKAFCRFFYRFFFFQAAGGGGAAEAEPVPMDLSVDLESLSETDLKVRREESRVTIGDHFVFRPLLSGFRWQ